MCSCGGYQVPRCTFTCCGDPPQKRNVFDMLVDSCAKKNWHCAKTQLYGSASSGQEPTCPACIEKPPCCRFPPRQCPPPPPPPASTCSQHRCNAPRPCGFIVKPSCFPGGKNIGCVPPAECCGMGGSGNPCCVNVDCSRPSKCPVPDPCNSCCATSLYCRPPWKHPPLKSNPGCARPPPLAPRSFRYKNWLAQFEGKVDTNLCASRYSSRVDRSGCNMVIVEPPACDECPPCPCHPCA